MMVRGTFSFFFFGFINFQIWAMYYENSGSYLQNLPKELKFMIIENLNHNKSPILSLKNLISFSRTNKENYLLSKIFLNLLVKLILIGKYNIEEIFPKLAGIHQLILKKDEEISGEDKLCIEREIKLLCYFGNLNFSEVGNYVSNFCKKNLTFFNTINGKQVSLNKILYSIFLKLLNDLVHMYEIILNKQCILLQDLILSFSPLDYNDLNFIGQLKEISQTIQSILDQIIRFKYWKTILCSDSFYRELYEYRYPNLEIFRSGSIPNVNKELEKNLTNSRGSPQNIFTFEAKVTFDSGYCDGKINFESTNEKLRYLLNESLAKKQWFLPNDF